MDITTLVASAADLALDRLEIKLEHDGFVGAGERSYSEEDIEGIKLEMNELAELSAMTSSHKVFALSDDAYSVLCGLVQDTKTLDERDLDIESIMSCEEGTWDELRTIFPFDDYKGSDGVL